MWDPLSENEDASTKPVLGRSKSMHRSSRIAAITKTSSQLKHWLEWDDQDYSENDVLAVVSDAAHAGSSPFQLCIITEEVDASQPQIDVIWLEKKDGGLYHEGEESTLKDRSRILTTVSLIEREDSTYRLNQQEERKITKALEKKNKPAAEEEEKDGQPVAKKAGKGRAKKAAAKEDKDFEEQPKEEESDEEKEDDDEEEEEKPAKKTRGKRAAAKATGRRTVSAKKAGGRKAKAGDDDDDLDKPTTRGRKRKADDITPKDDSAPKKKGRAKAGAAKKSSAKRAKRGKQIGEANPDIEVVEKDRFSGADGNVNSACCTFCASKEVIRAAVTNNLPLLASTFGNKNVYSLTIPRSADVPLTAFDFAIKHNHVDVIRELIKQTTTPTVVHDRLSQPRINIQEQDTGTYDQYTYGHAVRALNAARGGREGNNAFLSDQEQYGYGYNNVDATVAIEVALTTPGVAVSTIQVLWQEWNGFQFTVPEHVHTAVRYGHREVAGWLVNQLFLRDGFGYNFLHKEALNLNGPEFSEAFRAISVRKKCLGNQGLSPVHFACINPNPKYLIALLNVDACVDLQDDEEWQPIHYAAACEGTGPLEYLLKNGADIYAQTSDGRTPLHVAAEAGRAHNIEVLLRGKLEKPTLSKFVENAELHEALASEINSLLHPNAKKAKKQKDDDAMEAEAAPAVAVNTEIIESVMATMLEKDDFKDLFAEPVAAPPQAPPAAIPAPPQDEDGDGEDAMNVDQPANLFGAPPAFGGADLRSKQKRIRYIDVVDQSKMTALHLAAYNGHAEAVKMLIRRFAAVDAQDSTKRTPLVLASMYGHMEVVKALVEAGRADLSKKDKIGRLPLIHAAKNGHLPVLSYLVHMGADVNACDTSKNTPAFYAAAFGFPECVDFLVKAGADPNAFNDWKTTPLGICMSKSHLACAEALLNHKEVNVNFVDDQGHTLTAQAVQNLTDSTAAGSLTQLDFLVTRKHADVTIKDAHGRQALHLLASTFAPTKNTDYQNQQRRQQWNQALSTYEYPTATFADEYAATAAVNIAKILIGGKADINAVDNASRTALGYAVEKGNKALVAFLLQQPGVRVDIGFPRGSILTSIVQTELLSDWTKVLNLLSAEASFRPHLQQAGAALDDNGFTPLLAALHYYSQWNFQLYYAHQPQHAEWHQEELLREVSVRNRFRNFISTLIKASSSDVSASVDKMRKFRPDAVPGEAPGPGPVPLTPAKPPKQPRFVNSDDDDEEIADYNDDDDDNDDGQQADQDGGANKETPEDLSKVPLEQQYCSQGLYSVCHFLAMTTSDDKLCELILDLKPDVNKKNLHGETPIHFAVQLDNIAFCKRLIARKADVNLYNTAGTTPLHFAAQTHNLDLVNLFLDTGADANLTSKQPPNPKNEKIPITARTWNQTPLYMACSQPNRHNAHQANNKHSEPLAIIRALLKAKANPNITRADGHTSLLAAIAQHHNDAVFKALLDAKANPNAVWPRVEETDPETKVVTVNGDGEAPIHKIVRAGNHATLMNLIRAEADPSLRIPGGDAPIHLAATTRNLRVVQELLKAGAKVNDGGYKRRTALHHACNGLAATMDYNFELEEFLLKEAGADVNALDDDKRTPFHYNFVKMGKGLTDTTEFDPIEATTWLCNIPGIQVDLPDRFGRSALHYAAMHGASISSLFLLERKTDLNRVDEEGNTPLALALRSKHPQYALFMIREKADVTKPVVHVTRSNVSGENNKILTRSEQSMFMPAVVNNWQGVAYLLLDAKFNYHIAMNDALSCEHFTLVENLLNKTQDQVVRSVLEKTGQNLLHTLAVYGGPVRIAEKLVNRGVNPTALDNEGRLPLHYAANLALVSFFLQHKSNPNAVDKHGTPPLNTIAKAGKLTSDIIDELGGAGLDSQDPDGKTALIHLLEQHGNNHAISNLLRRKANVNILDKTGQSALIYVLKDRVANIDLSYKHKDHYTTRKEKHVGLELLEGGALTTVQYLKPIFEKGKKVRDETTNLLYESVILNNEKLTELFLLHDKYADLGFVGPTGLSILHHAILKNSLELVSLIVVAARHSKKTNAAELINYATADKGFTAVHFCVKSAEFGSFENTDIIRVLARNGGDLNKKDKHSRPPLWYSALQDSGDVTAALIEAGATPLRMAPTREPSAILLWPESGIDVNLDSEEAMKDIGEEMTPEKPLVDPSANIAHGVVLQEGDDLYEVLLTIVDIKHGTYGINNFYKMQVIQETVKNMFVLFTRWGRIGQTGQYQRTPFASKEEAMAEFEKIFKSKTGNLWAERANFERKPKKYKLMDVNHSKKHHKDLLKVADWNKMDIDSVLADEVQLTMRIISNVTMLTKAVQSSGIDLHQMPLGRITKKSIAEAMHTLTAIKEAIETLNQIRKEPIPNMDSVAEAYETISDLSSAFFELFPQANFAHQAIQPIENENMYRQYAQMLDNLVNIEVASKILIGALHRSKEMSPLDYIFKALECKFEALPHDDMEHSIIKSYLTNTLQGNHAHELETIYRVQRKGEAERIQRWLHHPNRFLLWHGSPTCNFIGILSTGLRIAPPESAIAGAAFGQGLYFADMAAKSYAYCRGNNGTVFLLLCEVVLGNMYEMLNYKTVPLPNDYQSIKGLGSTGPDWKNSLVMPNGVRIPANTAPIKYPAPKWTQDFPPNAQAPTAQPAFGAGGFGGFGGFGGGFGQPQYQQIQQGPRVLNYSLPHSEFIVPDVSQVRIRYLLQLKPRNLKREGAQAFI